MLNDPKSGGEVRQALSALADGELSAQETRQLLQSWQHDADARACWHAYHVVGDVLRSDELAVQLGRDAAFVHRLRGRLALEPVPLATVALGEPAREVAPVVATGTSGPMVPAVAPSRIAAARTRYRLLAPAAVAAGFVAVAGALVVFRGFGPPESGGPELAVATPAAQPQRVGHVVLREAWLDRYLQAHRRQTPNVLVAPGGQGQVVQVIFEKP